MNQTQIRILEGKYKEHISQHRGITDEELRNSFLEILELRNPLQRVEEWKDLKLKVSSFRQLVYLANPFFIGYGNPDSEILFLGKEKAFNMKEEPELFIHESVNNLLQWERLNAEDGTQNPKQLLQDLGFNPMFPRPFFAGKFKKRHTWGLYSEIVRQLQGLTGEILNTPDYENSFFRHCFLSEINYIPSRYSEGRKLDSVRKEFLQQDFYRRFPIVIIGANGYLHREDIREIFGATEVEAVVLGRNRLRSINASIFSSATQKIVLCNQLSGAAGWTKEALMMLAAQCQTGTEKEAVNF